ncbi:hypothetical protein M569_12428, partial [Genlisea aurea]
MGCVGSSEAKTPTAKGMMRKPRPWSYPQPMARTHLIQLRDEFWDSAPRCGGRQEIWDALRAAAEGDPTQAHTVLDSAGITVHRADLSVCYDRAGVRYELPNYVLSDPTNL